MKIRSASAFLSVLTVVVAMAVWTGGSHLASRQVAERAAPAVREDSREQILKAYANQPVTFVENRGQLDTQVRYYAQGSRYAFYFTPEAAVLTLMKGTSAPSKATLDAQGSGIPDAVKLAAVEAPAQGVALALRFLGSNPQVMLEGQERAPGVANYLRGDDPARWQTGLPSYAQVVYRELWPGVDLMLREQAGKLKYEFRVQPGAQVADIRLGYDGADGLTLDGDGGLRVQTALGVLQDTPPVAWQEIAGVRVPVGSRYALTQAGAEMQYGFALDAGYQPDHELIIDPGLDYSTFLGGASHEVGASIAVDASGNAYVTGLTQSPNFPTTSGAFDRTGAASNNLDVFVSKLNATGTALIYSTFLGGSNFDWGRAITLDGAGNAYVTGQTKSSDFPTTSGAFDRSFNVGTCPRCGIDQYDAFVAKLNPAGSGLVYSTFLGGIDIDDGLGIAVDGAGNAYATGQTTSSNFPTTAGAFDTSSNGGYDGFVTKLNAAGSALVYSTYLGGSDNELPENVALDATGNAYVGGSTRSAGFPTTPGAFDTSHNGGAFDELFDIFVTKLNVGGSALVYSTFLGGSKSDFGNDLTIDGAGNAYITGATLSPEFPTTPGTFDTVFDSDSEGFVTKLNATGSALVYSTFLGEAGASAIALDANNNAWLSGGTSSPNAATTPDAFDTQFNGVSDAYIAKLNQAGSALLYATFLGGTASENGNDIALSIGGNVYVTGHTYSADFPTTPGAFDVVFNGDPGIFWGDGFVIKLGTGSAPPAPALSSLTLSPASVVGGSASTGTVALTSAAPSGGVQVALSSSNATVASVPASVTVAAGATQATFTVTTSSVSASTAATISATYNGATRAATLTVSPPATGPLPAPTLVSPANDARFSPGQAITFDWSDVAGAANYTLQIDDSQSFSAPLTLSQTTTASQFTTSTLPTKKLWWRVRANTASGAPGNWSSVKHFEVKR